MIDFSAVVVEGCDLSEVAHIACANRRVSFSGRLCVIESKVKREVCKLGGRFSPEPSMYFIWLYRNTSSNPSPLYESGPTREHSTTLSIKIG